MKKAFLALKFHDGEEDKKFIEDITSALLKADISTFVMARDVEKYGKADLPKGAKLMPDYAFPQMKKSDLFVVEFTEKGVGLGIGAGFAYASGVPVYVIAKTGSDISKTIESLATKVFFYDDVSELTELFRVEFKNKK